MGKQKKVIVIGGGIAGLSAGCYLQMNGFTTEVYETAPTPGGVTASWKRKGYTFDGGTNWFPGSGPRCNFYPLINELLDFKNHRVIDFDKFMRVCSKDGPYLDVFTDVDKLRNEMVRIAPEDKKTIDTFINAIRFASKCNLPVEKPKELFSLSDYLKIGVTSLPLGLFYSKWRKITLSQFARKFSNPHLRHLFENIFPRHGYFSVLGLIMALAWMSIDAAGYPLGGSQWIISSLLEKYHRLGGTLYCSKGVSKIITHKRMASGVLLDDGTEKHSDIVIAACDSHSTHYRLLDGRYTTPRIDSFYQTAPVFPALIQISLGCRKNFSDFTHKTVLEFSPPLQCGSDTINLLQVRFCHFDQSLAPDGGTSVIVHLRTHDYQYWVNLRKNNRIAYNEEKQRITERVIEVLESYCGPLRASIEVIDTATPATYIRYTNIYKGSYQSWAPTPKLIGNSLDKKVPGLLNFYFCGQWVEPAGGLPRAVLSSRNVVQMVCADNGMKFSAVP